MASKESELSMLRSIASTEDQALPVGGDPRLLRNIPCSKRHFWKASSTSQLSQKVYDKDMNGHKRALPGNEVFVMALNEIATDRGQGFFLYLPNRST